MAVSLKNMGSRLTACAPALLLLLLAAVVAPALARSTAENRIEEKSARNAEWLRFPTQEMPEIHWGKALTTQYDTSGDSFAPKKGIIELDEMASKGARGAKGTPFTKAEIETLNRDLGSFTEGKVSLKQDQAFINRYNQQNNRNAAALFDKNTGTIYVGNGAGYSDFIHEFFHMKQWLEVGKEAYNGLSVIQKESYVLEKLLQPHIWRNLTVAEREVQIASYQAHMLEAQATLAPNQRSVLKTILDRAKSHLNDPVGAP